jgi:peroxiredoxin
MSKSGIFAVMALIALGVLLMVAPVFADSYQDKVDKDHRVELHVGQMPPDFTIKDLGGMEIKLSDFRGSKPVVIDFWATWCGWCVKEMPLLETFTEQYGDQVAVLCITSEEDASHDAVVKFVQDSGYKMDYIQDSSKAISTSYGVRGIPHLVIIGTDGTIAAVQIGYREDTVQKLVDILSLPPVEGQTEQPAPEQSN